MYRWCEIWSWCCKYSIILTTSKLKKKNTSWSQLLLLVCCYFTLVITASFSLAASLHSWSLSSPTPATKYPQDIWMWISDFWYLNLKFPQISQIQNVSKLHLHHFVQKIHWGSCWICFPGIWQSPIPSQFIHRENLWVGCATFSSHISNLCLLRTL